MREVGRADLMIVSILRRVAGSTNLLIVVLEDAMARIPALGLDGNCGDGDGGGGGDGCDDGGSGGGGVGGDELMEKGYVLAKSQGRESRGSPRRQSSLVATAICRTGLQETREPDRLLAVLGSGCPSKGGRNCCRRSVPIAKKQQERPGQ
jgi:hypothetical protein